MMLEMAEGYIVMEKKYQNKGEVWNSSIFSLKISEIIGSNPKRNISAFDH